jgi:YD repeat-containing protein
LTGVTRRTSAGVAVECYATHTDEPTTAAKVDADSVGAGAPVQTRTAYDALDRLTTLTHQTGGGTSLASYTYAFDAIGRLTRETNAEGTVTFSYDNSHQLVGADRPVGQSDESYSYDTNGNRTMTGYTTGTGNRVLASPEINTARWPRIDLPIFRCNSR